MVGLRVRNSWVGGGLLKMMTGVVWQRAGVRLGQAAESPRWHFYVPMYSGLSGPRATKLRNNLATFARSLQEL